MSESPGSFLAAVRESCPPGLWSRGVSLQRRGAVSLVEAGEDQFLFRVAPPGGIVAESVSLFPDDEDWECSCRSRAEACEHVAAAAIGLRVIREGGSLPTAPRPEQARVIYALRPLPEGLEVARHVRSEEGEQPLRVSLVALARGRADGPRIVPESEDLELEQLLGGRPRGVFPPARFGRLLRILSRCAEVRLGGRTVEVSAESLRPSIAVEEAGPAYRLILLPPVCDRKLTQGLALRGETLHQLADPDLTAREREELARGRIYGPERAAELVTEILPDLAQRVPVDVRTERLPRVTRCRPELLVEVRTGEGWLELRPELVYGRPPLARVREGRMQHLGGDAPVRDREAETRLLQRLRRLGLVAGEWQRLSGEAAVTAAQALRRLPSARTEGEGLEQFFIAPPVEPRLLASGLEFELVFVGRRSEREGAGESRATAGAALAAWRRGDRLVPLEQGGFAPLPLEWMQRHAEILEEVLEARELGGRLPRALAGDLIPLEEETEGGDPQRLRSMARGLEAAFGARTDPRLPEGFRGTLRSYQRDGVLWLQRLRQAGVGGLLADDMGLGKTLQALCAIEGRTLVVCPTSVLHNWRDEIERFRPGTTVCVYHGPGRKLDGDALVTLTTYALLRLDAEQLQAERWDAAILDEAQAIKNPDSRVARAACRLNAGLRLALSGTPVENRLEELWSQMRFANPGLLGSRRGFNKRWAQPIAEGDAEAAARLRARLKPFILRRLKSEVAPELPPRTDVVLRCTLSPEEREVYDALRLSTREEVLARLRAGQNVIAALEALLRLRQAACHVGLLPGREERRSSKTDLLVEQLQLAADEGHRSLVFSQWTSLLDLVEPRIGATGLDWLRLDGSTADRAGVVRRFQDESGPPVMLVSLRAGGTGLNLMAADHVFLLDPWWNPAVEDQAADRTHRIGQQRPVLVHRLVSEETVEERILALQAHKRRLADAALAEAGAAASLSRDELIALLE